MTLALLFMLLGTVDERPYNMPVKPEDVEFTDPSFKGSLVAYDRPRIPEQYRGIWADRLANCVAGSSQVDRIEIETFAIGGHRVVKVETYSDHPAVIVTLRGAPQAWLDIALDQNHISRRRHSTEPQVLMRCPNSASNVADRQGWLDEAQAACENDDFDLFSDVFLRSPEVRRKYVAKQVKLIGPTETSKLPRQRYNQIPFALRDYRAFETSTSRESANMSVSSGELPNGLFRIDWLRTDVADGSEIRDDDIEPHVRRTAGWLIFSKNRGCWQLIEDGLAIEQGEKGIGVNELSSASF